MHVWIIADSGRRCQFADQLVVYDRVRAALRSKPDDWSVFKLFLDDLYFLGVWLDDMHAVLLAEHLTNYGTQAFFYPDDWDTLDDVWLQLERELKHGGMIPRWSLLGIRRRAAE